MLEDEAVSGTKNCPKKQFFRWLKFRNVDVCLFLMKRKDIDGNYDNEMETFWKQTYTTMTQ